MTYERIEDIPYNDLLKGGAFNVKTRNIHGDLKKRISGAVGCTSEDEWAGGGTAGFLSDGGGPEPSGPWLILIVFALMMATITAFIVISSVAISSAITTIKSDPVNVIGRDSQGRPVLLRTQSGKVMTIGYDGEGSAYIKDVEDPEPWIPGLTPDIMLYVILGLAVLVVIVLVLSRTSMGSKIKEAPKPEAPKEELPKKAPKEKEKTKEEGDDQFTRM